jgi:hypothetical protein
MLVLPCGEWRFLVLSYDIELVRRYGVDEIEYHFRPAAQLRLAHLLHLRLPQTIALLDIMSEYRRPALSERRTLTDSSYSIRYNG